MVNEALRGGGSGLTGGRLWPSPCHGGKFSVSFCASDWRQVMASSEMELEKSETVRLMATALDQVLDRLPESVDRTDEMRREVALLIVDRFSLGEHAPDRLADLALAEVAPAKGEADQLTLAPDPYEPAERADGAEVPTAAAEKYYPPLTLTVMPGLVPGIHVLQHKQTRRRGWPG